MVISIDQIIVDIDVRFGGVIASLRQQRNNLMGSEMQSPLIPIALQAHKYHYVPH